MDLVNYFITFRLMDNAPPNNVTVSSGSVEPPMRDRVNTIKEDWLCGWFI